MFPSACTGLVLRLLDFTSRTWFCMCGPHSNCISSSIGRPVHPPDPARSRGLRTGSHLVQVPPPAEDDQVIASRRDIIADGLSILGNSFSRTRFPGPHTRATASRQAAARAAYVVMCSTAAAAAACFAATCRVAAQQMGGWQSSLKSGSSTVMDGRAPGPLGPTENGPGSAVRRESFSSGVDWVKGLAAEQVQAREVSKRLGCWSRSVLGS
ncbi:uncharacterized protein K444DRAFT_666026 [Hyaloscypha bicolor E]|uniref:Uncharacterized protein n=1 Tax=Hyaloscypha bicolor E TaxID=1095630 RepID=A0A2J6T031_9HELO|nr:uncharacterized protein K444DRAFT_666026 [Hyaloscypha bicolor E]PMD56401.1 hypothetical protein K444DRAFT_666026 [Hyaloscypha bicolor E]